MLSNYHFMKKDCFTIESIDNLIQLLEENGKSFYQMDYFIPTNNAFVYSLKDGSQILLPNNIVDRKLKGFLFKDKDCLQEMIQNDYYPIENSNKTVYELHQKHVKNINLNINYYQEKLNEAFKVDYSSVEKDVLNKYFRLLKQKKIKQNRVLSLELYFALGVLIGEFLRIENGGKWILIKEYGTYNPYFIPAVMYKGENICKVHDQFQGHFLGDFQDIDLLFKLRGVISPKLTLNRFYANNQRDRVIVLE